MEPKYIIKPSDIAVVIHTHPPRLAHLDMIRNSLFESDVQQSEVENFEIAVQPENCTNYEKILFWLMFLNAQARRAPYVLRLEDDIIVNKHIIHNLCTWSALRDPVFGCGLMFTHPDIAYKFSRNEYGLVTTEKNISYAQAQLFESKALVAATKRVWEVYAVDGYVGSKIDTVWSRYDGTITMALFMDRKRTYLHRPSLVDCSEVAKIDSIHSRRKGGAHNVTAEPRFEVNEIPHRAVDFDPIWRR
jgi:hypothetical protein